MSMGVLWAGKAPLKTIPRNPLIVEQPRLISFGISYDATESK